MTTATTLSELQTAVRERSNMENSQFVSDSELTRYINQSAAELYDLVVSVYEDYDLQSLSFSYTSDDGYTLPADFYKLRGVDFQQGSDWLVVDPFSFVDRNKATSRLYRSYYPSKQYRLVGNKIKFIPLGTTGTFRLWYIPSFTKLVVAGDAISLSSSIEGWDEYIICDAAIKCMQKEESDPSILMAQKQALIMRIKNMAANRDADRPQVVTDVRINDWNEDPWL